MSEKTLKIIQGIAQAAANAYDGAHDNEGNRIEIGLRREEGDMVLNSRTMDGFKVRCDGNHLVVCYQSDIKLKDVYSNNFESDLEQTCQDIANWLKKEYKKITGESLSLTPAGEVDAMVQTTSRVRVFVNATKKFKIGGLEGVEDRLEPTDEKRLDAKFKEFLGLGGLGKRPKNDRR